MPFRIIRDDITRVRADAIVNTANPKPVYASGTDQAIYLAAGAEQLLAERRKIGEIHPGEAAVTHAFDLPARYIIHTVGPAWYGGDRGEYDILRSCYRKSLYLAEQLRCESIAFPLISTGVYGFPRDKALDIALESFREFLEDSEMEITLVVFDRKALELSSSRVAGVEQYIDENYVERRRGEEYRPGDRREERRKYDSRDEAERKRRWNFSLNPFGNALSGSAYRDSSMPVSAPVKREDTWEEADDSADHLADYCASTLPMEQAPPPKPAGRTAKSDYQTASARKKNLQDVMKNVGESFQERLMRMIDERGYTDAQVYKKANLDRKLFSKIRCNADYCPKKKTALSLALALELNLDETTDLLSRAGYAFSPSSKADIIIRFCILNEIYDVMEVDSMLFKYEQPTLG